MHRNNESSRKSTYSGISGYKTSMVVMGIKAMDKKSSLSVIRPPGLPKGGIITDLKYF